jgi:hypothetical protein
LFDNNQGKIKSDIRIIDGINSDGAEFSKDCPLRLSSFFKTGHMERDIRNQADD